jgi:phosphoribosylaminoimidazole-succinocarboxamide synthase
MNLAKRQAIYSGKAKSLYETDDAELLITEFRDDTTAFDGEKHEKLADKGRVNNAISAHIMEILAKEGVPTHFHSLLSPTESLVKRLKMLPIENVVRNVAAGSICRRLGLEAGLELNPPLHELFLKNDTLHDPLISAEHALRFEWATSDQLNEMKSLSLKINEILKALFAEHDMILVDAKYEFGVGSDGRVYLGDEISPDSCRIWDMTTREKLDKDRFRQDLGNVVASYQKIAKRLGINVGEVPKRS